MLHNISLISHKMPLISLILPLSFHKPHTTIYMPTPMGKKSVTLKMQAQMGVGLHVQWSL